MPRKAAARAKPENNVGNTLRHAFKTFGFDDGISNVSPLKSTPKTRVFRFQFNESGKPRRGILKVYLPLYGGAGLYEHAEKISAQNDASWHQLVAPTGHASRLLAADRYGAPFRYNLFEWKDMAQVQHGPGSNFTPELAREFIGLLKKFRQLKPGSAPVFARDYDWSYYKGTVLPMVPHLASLEEFSKKDANRLEKFFNDSKGLVARMDRRVVHGDFHWRNVQRDRKSGKLIAEDGKRAGWDSPLYDVASLLIHNYHHQEGCKELLQEARKQLGVSEKEFDRTLKLMVVRRAVELLYTPPGAGAKLKSLGAFFLHRNAVAALKDYFFNPSQNN